jgi:hypothetical protein
MSRDGWLRPVTENAMVIDSASPPGEPAPAPAAADAPPPGEDAPPPARPLSRTEQEREDALAREPDVLAAITRLREFEADRRVRVPVRREVRANEYVDLGAFHIRPLAGSQIERLQEQCMVWRKDASGKRHERVIDVNRFAGWLVLEATEPEDRQRWWESPEVRQRLGVGSSLDAITRLLAGAKQAVAQKVLEISGYDPNLEEVLSSS